MAVPKRRTTRSKRDMRRANHDKVTMPSLSVCSQCGVFKRPHYVCKACGFYKGRAVLPPAIAGSTDAASLAQGPSEASCCIANMDDASLPMRTKILGTGHYVPPIVRTNTDVARMVDTSDDWITERTGIKERRIAPEGMATSDMATEAAKQALAQAGLQAVDVDMILVATVTPDYQTPATAVLVQRNLGAVRSAAMDVSAACAGFLFGLFVAEQFLCTRAMRHVLLIGAELLSRVVNWQDRTTCIMFGDGAGAVLLGASSIKENASGLLSIRIFTDGELASSLCIPGGGSAMPLTHALLDQQANTVSMRGSDIFKVGVKYQCMASEQALHAAGLDVKDIDWFCFHQANLRIIQQIVIRLRIPSEKVLTNIVRVGNTSSASIPILLDENVRAGIIRSGDTVLLCALGAGVTYGAAVLRM